MWEIIRSLRWYHTLGLYIGGIFVSLIVTEIIARLLSITDTGNKIGILQTVLAIVVFVPTVYTIIQQSQETTDLHLNITSLPTDIMDPEAVDLPCKDVSFEIINKGNIISTWFFVRVFVKMNEKKDYVYLHPHMVVGDETHWTRALLEEVDGNIVTIFTFMSNGDYAAYIGDGFRFIDFRFVMDSKATYPINIPISYNITSDKGLNRKGSYNLVIEKLDSLH